MSFPKLMIYLSHVPVFYAGVYAGVVYRELIGELRAFARFVMVAALVQLVSLVLWFLSENNLPLLHLYVPGSFILLGAFYHQVLKGYIPMLTIPVMVISFTTYSVINSIYIQPVHTFNSYALTISSMLIVMLSLSMFMFLLQQPIREKKKDLLPALTWINSGLFIYYLSGMLIFYFGSIMITFFSQSTNRYIWTMHSFFSITMYICIIIGLWKRPQNP